mmetsp:Transcript_8837/g.22234  ORF Transcript_8837/g.22234 Transcript_8837/m.22234 type:complete len:500 (+) Transcript_8837:1391-2890(+)
MKDGTLIQALRVLAAALALRVALVVIGVGQYLVYRVETSTPANSLLTIREGVALLGLGIAPYSGSACHVPPLLLWLLAPTALHTYLYTLPNIVCDVMGALMLRQTAQQLMRRPHAGGQQRSSSTRPDGGAEASSSSPAWLTPNAVMALYLLNPFTVASCICGSTSPVENLAVLASLWRATAGDAPGAAFGVALATYLGLHPIILLVPIALLTAQGPEDCTGTGQQQQQQQEGQQQQGQQQQQQGQGQVVQQELLPPPLQHQERSGKSDPGMAHPPSTPTSYSSQGSGGLTPLGGDVASMRAASENCRSNNPHCSTFVRSNSNFGRSQSRLGSSSAKRESSPAWVGWSKAGGEVEVEGLASVMDGCQRLVDSVTSRVLQQLQESRPELQARHAHPSDSRHGPWASRRSLDLCNNDMRRLSGSGKPGGAKLARKSRGATGHRDRNGSLSLDIPHPALAAAFPRQVSQPSPYAQAHTPPRGPSVQQSAPATAQQPVPGNIHP